jgi:IS5 family transposase
LAEKIHWAFPEQRLGEVYAAGDGHPPLPIRLVAGLFILKHTHSPRPAAARHQPQNRQ